jgi:hypothetical protein
MLKLAALALTAVLFGIALLPWCSTPGGRTSCVAPAHEYSTQEIDDIYIRAERLRALAEGQQAVHRAIREAMRDLVRGTGLRRATGAVHAIASMHYPRHLECLSKGFPGLSERERVACNLIRRLQQELEAGSLPGEATRIVERLQEELQSESFRAWCAQGVQSTCDDTPRQNSAKS